MNTVSRNTSLHLATLRPAVMRDFLRIISLSVGVGLACSIAFGFIVMLLAGNAVAEEMNGDAPVHLSDTKQGSLLFKSKQPGEYLIAPTLNTDVSIKVTGMIARATVKQTFHNTSKQWMEGVYVFPLPENAAVDHLRMQVGERTIEGMIKEKGEARAVYEQAKQQGKKASLLEQERPNIFTSSVANIGPDEDVVVEIEYQQTLHYDQGSFRLRFPMVVAPRYTPGNVTVEGFAGTGWAANTDAVPDAARVTPPVILPGQKAINPVSLKIQLDAGFPLARLDSSYHKINIAKQNGNSQTITLQDGVVPANKDFELVWTPDVGHAPQAALFTETRDNQTYALLMIMPPVKDAAAKSRIPREVIFVQDTSGSMEGTSMLQAKQGLHLALQKLGNQDRFNVIQFNSVTDVLFREAQPVTTATIKQAHDYVEGLHATGGTEMLAALDIALNNSANPNIVRQVIFLTDGSVSNEQQLFDMIQKKLGDSRLFTVGIGSAPNSHFMSKAAQFGHGTFTYIGDVAEVADKMGQLFSKLESPALTNISIKWPQGVLGEMWPNTIADLYLGEPVVVAVSLKELKGNLILQGMQGATPWQSTLPLKGGANESGVGVLWARSKIGALLDTLHVGEDDGAVRKSVIEIALQHHLVSKYTSLVAVDTTPSRPNDEVTGCTALPTNLPEGWSHEAVFGTLPQTATWAQVNLLLGLIAFTLACVVWQVRRVHGNAASHV